MLRRARWNIVGCLVLLTAGSVLAQFAGPQDPASRQVASGGAARGHRGFGWLALVLVLTPDQIQTGKAIFEKAHKEGEPYRESLKESRKALTEAVKTGDKAAIDAVIDGRSPNLAAVAKIRASARADFYALLTPEQKSKLEKMGDFGRRRMRHWFGGA